eukprot:maker-scaffold_1-snap-gene-18.40-mRNA-1 protein AED:0.01 eAED:0.01 QI:119/1/1/1/1/1/3/300/582
MFGFGSKKPDPNNKDATELAEKISSQTDEKPAPATGFDPTGLERAAKAAGKLRDSEFAQEAIKIVKLQEETKKAKSKEKIEENIAKQKEFDVQRVRAQEEERRRTIQADQEARQRTAQYQDQLARKRLEDQSNLQRQLKDEELRKQEESQKRIEALRRQTAEYEARVRKETETARVKAESEGRIEQERKNWDLHMQRTKLEQAELRKTVLQGVKEAGTMIGEGFRDFLQDKEKMLTTVGIVTALALGVYTARTSTSVAGKLIEARLSQPPLVRETSKVSFTRALSHPVRTFGSLARSFSATDPNAIMKNIILEDSMQKRLQNFAHSTQNTFKNRAPFRNMLLYGPPGTGKTLFAKQLSQQLGMNFAIMTGSDVLPLGSNSVTEIHKLFDWAEKSRKGLVLFVDEAETFLRKRTAEGSTGLSENSRNALNAFLYRTGTSSKKFMVVFATNQPDEIDFAIFDRVDEMVKFQLPKLPERKKILELNFTQHIINGHKVGGFGSFGGPEPIKVQMDNVEAYLKDIAEKLEGFSGRELHKLVIAWQAMARGSKGAKLAKEDMDVIVQQRVEQHLQRTKWGSDQFDRAT